MLKTSAKTDYACKALMELALTYPSDHPISISTIANKQKIPVKFLTQILLNLKHLGLVESVRGKQGGYILLKAPKDITLADVILAFEAQKNVKNIKEATPGKKDAMAQVWKELTGEIMGKLNELNFEVICNKKKQLDNVVSYEI